MEADAAEDLGYGYTGTSRGHVPVTLRAPRRHHQSASRWAWRAISALNPQHGVVAVIAPRILSWIHCEAARATAIEAGRQGVQTEFYLE